MTGYKDLKEWRKNTKRKLVEGFGSKCACCGLKDNPIVYDFHHLNPNEKDFQISSSKKTNWNSFVIEAKKCILVCVICHRKIHSGLIKIPENFQKFDETLVESIKPHFNVGLIN